MAIDNSKLRRRMLKAFDVERLEILCTDISSRLEQEGSEYRVSLDLVGGRGLENIINRLIEYLNRRGLKDYLLDAIRKTQHDVLIDVELNEHLEETLQLYLSKSFKDEQVVRLDQAGETDPDRITLLRQVFVDLDVKPRGGDLLRHQRIARFIDRELAMESPRNYSGDRAISAMNCLLQEVWPMIVVIGGPGQGKSTLGQYFAQVHRAVLLGRLDELRANLDQDGPREHEFTPQTPRVPFRIVLKYFAQWLADGPRLDSVEAYLAEQMEKDTSRKVSTDDIQMVLRARPCLVIFDGLDEVIEPDLRGRLLDRVGAFLDRAGHLLWDTQILSTSRPTGYSNQFDPTKFWHLELQPMSIEKMLDYSQRWTLAKVPNIEERRRVIDTIKECQQEEHTKLLLTTPLQVTIVLLIIKDGGRPPAQREALFNEYWGTIYRREKAKAKGFIRTEEALLFELHSYLGYILHSQAATENVRSLLPEAEFQKAVVGFLRSKDSRSPDELIQQRAVQMVKEARDRLVLLVEPQPGFFGFELRSLQEFFAAAYLAQTARDTQQRFHRLKAIARSEHWHNVTLFFAGRIVRNFGGEAANILELVCRPMDREPPDYFLRRGAWLALDIAADGAFAAYPDLQYAALEYALTVLEIGSDINKELHAAMRRLSQDDRYHILGPLLRKKLKTLPEASLCAALSIYGEYVGVDEAFMESLDILLSSTWAEHIKLGLDLGFKNRVEPRWIAKQLDSHWSVWFEERGARFLLRWWAESPEHTLAVINVWSPDRAKIRSLLDELVTVPPYLGYLDREPDYTLRLTTLTSSPSDQLIGTLQSLTLLATWQKRRHSYGYETGNRSIVIKSMGEIIFPDLKEISKRQPESAQTLGKLIGDDWETLLTNTNLMPHYKARLWELYWLSHEPTKQFTNSFLKDVRLWGGREIIQETFWSWTVGRQWPLLGIAARHQASGDISVTKKLKLHLDSSNEVKVCERVRSAVQTYVAKASEEERVKLFFGIHSNTIVEFPELMSLADSMAVSTAELVRAYITISLEDRRSLPVSHIEIIFSLIEANVTREGYLNWAFWYLFEIKWPLEKPILDKGKQLLRNLINCLSNNEDMYLFWLTTGLFLKLLALDDTVLQMASLLLTKLSSITPVEPQFRSVAICLNDITAETLQQLAGFMQHKDAAVRQGATNLLEVVTRAILYSRRRYLPNTSQRDLPKIASLRFDWKQITPLILAEDNVQRRQGATLLTFSRLPLSDENCANLLKAIEKRGRSEDEREAWMKFLEQFPVSKMTRGAWVKFLERILTRPRDYSVLTLTSAAQRYTSSVEKSDFRFEGTLEDLGLPIVDGGVLPTHPIRQKSS